MAVHHNLFPSQLIQDRELMNTVIHGNGNGVAVAYNAQQMRILGIPAATALPENQLSVCEAKTSVITDGGLTYNTPSPAKRSRESFDQFHAVQNLAFPPHPKSNTQLPPMGGFLQQIHQNQFEIDAIISQHNKKIRIEIEERQKQQSRLLTAAMGECLMKKLKEKDEQIQRIGKMNLALQERVKSLYVENQVWRDLAQTNEATANSLRSNLEQALHQHVGGEERISVFDAAVEDDMESCCGSSEGRRDAEALDKDEASSRCSGERRCRMCGERESCVLLLPCRHLCICSVCGNGTQQLQSCPVCNSFMTATLHVSIS